MADPTLTPTKLFSAAGQYLATVQAPVPETHPGDILHWAGKHFIMHSNRQYTETPFITVGDVTHEPDAPALPTAPTPLYAAETLKPGVPPAPADVPDQPVYQAPTPPADVEPPAAPPVAPVEPPAAAHKTKGHHEH